MQTINRWRVLAGSVLVLLCTGAIYAFSVFAGPLTSAHGWTMGQVNLAKLNPSTVLKYSEKPELDPYCVAGTVSMALLEELSATASIIGRAG